MFAPSTKASGELVCSLLSGVVLVSWIIGPKAEVSAVVVSSTTVVSDDSSSLVSVVVAVAAPTSSGYSFAYYF